MNCRMSARLDESYDGRAGLVPNISSTNAYIDSGCYSCDEHHESHEVKLVSHLQPPPHIKRTQGPQSSLWFKLPPEVRNYIYELLFLPEEYEIKWFHAGSRAPRQRRMKGLTHWRYRCPRSTLNPILYWGKMPETNVSWKLFFEKPIVNEQTLNRRKQLRRIIRKYPTSTIDHVPGIAAFLLTCRAIHFEGAQLLYSRATFSFESSGLAMGFLRNLSPLATSSLTKISLYHETYGEPIMTKDTQWKLKHDEIWHNNCKHLSATLVGLKELNILLRILDEPFEFRKLDGAGWFRPIMEFRRCKLSVFSIGLRYKDWSSSNNPKLQDCSERAKMMILGSNYRKPIPVKNNEKFARCGGGKIVKAKHVLVIRWYGHHGDQPVVC